MRSVFISHLSSIRSVHQQKRHLSAICCHFQKLMIKSSQPLNFKKLFLCSTTHSEERPRIVKGVLRKEKGDKHSSIRNLDDDNELKRLNFSESSGENGAIKATKVGALANAGLAISKGVVGVSVGSTGLIADAVNNLADLLCDAVVYLTVTEARKASTPDRPWGKGKLEPMGALGVSALLLGTGLGIGGSALIAMVPYVFTLLPLDSDSSLIQFLISAITKYFPVMVSSIEGGGGYHPSIELNLSDAADWMMHAAALGLSVISIGGKEWLYRYTIKMGEAANSAAVMANALQHRADVVISSAVLVGLLGAVCGYPFMDPLAGVVVSGFIVKQAFTTGSDAFKDLSDSPANANETEQLRKTCLAVQGILSVEKLLARRSGPYLYVECTVGVAGTISASAAHRLAELTRNAMLHEHFGRVANAVVHVSPLGSAGMGEASPSWARDHDHIAKEIEAAVLSLKDITSVSEVQVYYKDDGRIALKVDVCMNPELSIKVAHSLAVKARKAIEKVFPNVATVDVDLELEEILLQAESETDDSDERKK